MGNLQAIKQPNMGNIGTPVIALITGFLNLLVYCYLAYKATDHYLSVGDLLYEAKWNKLPRKYQKHFILMIQNAQRPVYYHGFKLIKIVLGTFTQVVTIFEKKKHLVNSSMYDFQILNTVYTYYMILKTLTQVQRL